ncbi:MAG: hypothetical protein VXW11_04115 [Pseudomonadota bacterium]|nr:hypothetical protein [Pseudomonadota bacterium]
MIPRAQAQPFQIPRKTADLCGCLSIAEPLPGPASLLEKSGLVRVEAGLFGKPSDQMCGPAGKRG